MLASLNPVEYAEVLVQHGPLPAWMAESIADAGMHTVTARFADGNYALMPTELRDVIDRDDT